MQKIPAEKNFAQKRQVLFPELTPNSRLESTCSTPLPFKGGKYILLFGFLAAPRQQYVL